MIVKFGQTSIAPVTLPAVAPPSEDIRVDANSKQLLAGYSNIQTAYPVGQDWSFTGVISDTTTLPALKALRGVKGYLYIDLEKGAGFEEYFGVVITGIHIDEIGNPGITYTITLKQSV